MSPTYERSARFARDMRIKRVQGSEDIWEMTWAADGRATFRYGQQVLPSEPHIVWLRIGTHAILDDPDS